MYQRYLDAEMQSPLDFFQILKWVAEPTMSISRRDRPWDRVWKELYLLTVAHGRSKALVLWKHLPTQQSTAALKAVGESLLDPRALFMAGSKDWGFHPKDAELIYAPFVNRKAEARGVPNHDLLVLRARLLLHQRNPKLFFESQHLRRLAVLYAMLRGITLLDEVDVLRISAEAQSTSPLAAVNREWNDHYNGVPTTWRIHEGVKDFFTVVWIGAGSRVKKHAPQRLYFEVHTFPGHVFEARVNTLSAMAHDHTMRLVARNLNELGAFLVAWLMVLGFVVDVITAGAASLTLRGLVFHFFREKLVEAALNEGLDVLKINNTYLRGVVQIGVGGIGAGRSKKLRTESDVDLAAGNVLWSTPKSGSSAVLSRGHSRDGSGVTDYFRAYDPNLVRGVPKEFRDRMRRAARLQYAEEGDDIAEMLTEQLGKLGAQADMAIEGLLSVQRFAGSVYRGTESAMMRTGRASVGSGALSRASGSGRRASRPSKATARAVRNAKRFADSDAYEALDVYKHAVRYDEWLKFHGKRETLRLELHSGKISLSAANDRLADLIYKARGAAGEELALVDVFGRFNVRDTVAIPTRGEKGVGMLDIAVRLEKGEPYRFVLVEAKGNTSTGLGKVTRKQYWYDSDNQLVSRPMPSGGFAEQGTAEWYYQKFAEIYLAGQRRGDRSVMKVAMELMDAAGEGKICFQVIKGSHLTDVVKQVDDTKTVSAWFARAFAPGNRGTLPIPLALQRP